MSRTMKAPEDSKIAARSYEGKQGLELKEGQAMNFIGNIIVFLGALLLAWIIGCGC